MTYQTIKVSILNDATAEFGSYDGTYEITKDKNDGKPIWVSPSNSMKILYQEDMKIWLIGTKLVTRGSLIGTNEEKKWSGFDGKSLKELGKEDIIVECIARKGKHNSVL